MPCNHKFHAELNLKEIDYVPTTLIVGTFIPAWPATSTGWFYGRTHDAEGNRLNSFWDILPRLYGESGLIDATPDQWKQFCRSKQIALTDLISTIDDADPANPEHVKVLTTFADKAIAYNFDDFEFVNIARLLKDNPSIKNVYLTRGITESFWKHSWNPVVHYCNHNKLHERRLLTPTTEAQYQHEAYNHDNPENKILLLEDYILMRWRQDWH